MSSKTLLRCEAAWRLLDADACAAVAGGTGGSALCVPLPEPCPLVAVIGPDGTIAVRHACDPGEPQPLPLEFH